MVTKICKFLHKIYYKSGQIEHRTQIFCTKLGILGVSQSNGVIQIFARPTPVAMITKIAKFK